MAFRPFQPISAEPNAPLVGDTSPVVRTPTTVTGGPTTDWGNIAGAGIGAAGQTIGTLAQLAGQRAAQDQALQQSQLNRALSEKMAKMTLAQNADQFAKSQGMQALMALLGQQRAALETGNRARDVRRGDEQLMGDVLARLYMPTRRY